MTTTNNEAAPVVSAVPVVARPVHGVRVCAAEVLALENVRLNRWPAETFLPRLDVLKWQLRIPMGPVFPEGFVASGLADWREGWATFEAAGGERTRVRCPLVPGDLLFMDEPVEILGVHRDPERSGVGSVDVRYQAGGLNTGFREVRTVLNTDVPAGLKPGRFAAPLPMAWARLERLQVKAIAPQRLGDITEEEAAAEGASRSMRPTSLVQGFFEFIWNAKWLATPFKARPDLWVWRLDVARVV